MIEKNKPVSLTYLQITCKLVISFSILLLALDIGVYTVYASGVKFSDVSCGECTTTALSEDGAVWTWGRMYGDINDNIYHVNSSSQVKYGYQSYYWSQYSPAQVPINNVIAIASGANHCLALKSDGTVWAWGYNEYGQLGDGTNITRSIPVQVINLNDVVAISAKGCHSLALKKDGTVWSWGRNVIGDLGDGTLDNRYMPVQVKNLLNITAIPGGSFAIQDDGTLWTWSMTLLSPGADGRIHDDNLEQSQQLCKPYPFPVPNVKNIVSIDTNLDHTVFVKADGTVWSWGNDALGQLGNGDLIESNWHYIDVPVEVKNLHDVKMVIAGSTCSMALKEDGTVWVWGHSVGQLGIGDGLTVATPAIIPKLSGIKVISIGITHAAFLDNNGTIWTCGQNNAGQIGNPTVDKKVDYPIKINIPSLEINGSSATPSAGIINTNKARATPVATGQANVPIPSPGFGIDLILLTVSIFICAGLISIIIGRIKTRK